MAFLAFLAAMAIGSSCSLFGMDASGSAKPRHVFLFIGDGMSYGSEVAASRYLYGADEGLAWHAFPFRAWAATWDASAYDVFAADALAPGFDESSFDPLLGYDPARGGEEPWPLGPDARAYLLRAATDSASAATAIATGLKTENGNIAWARGDPSGGALVTIAESARSRLGSAVGIVSTVPFNHATPAAFAAHSPRRDAYAGIAAEILGSTKPEVLIGGGHPGWNATYFTSAALADAAKTDPLALAPSIEPLRADDFLGSFRALNIPTLLVYGERDPAISIPAEETSNSTMTQQFTLEESGHFPMLDETVKFNRLLTDFLALESGASPGELEMKEEWKRRVR